jgi:hypothetical protein
MTAENLWMVNLKKRLQSLTRTLLLAVLMLVALPSFAQQAIKSDAPTRYVVKKGDTLWDIANTFLNEPWLWPNLWRTNTQISNPHLIYPGDVITVSFFEGKPVLAIERDKPSLVLSPSSSRREKAKAIDILPWASIAPYVNHHTLIDSDKYSSLPHILGNHYGNIRFTSDHTVLSQAKNTSNDQYKVVRKQSTIYALNGEPLGVQLTHIADTQAVATQQTQEVKMLKITHSYQEAKRGDRLLTHSGFVAEDLLLTAANEQRGYVVGDLHDHNLLGKYDVVILDVGAADIAAGTVMGIYRAGPDIIDGDIPRYVDEPGVSVGANLLATKIAQPAIKVGELIVFKTFAKASYGLITRANEGIQRGFIVASP